MPSLLGDNLAARLRSTSLALVGVVGAAALAMVGLTLHYGVAVVSSGPIHDPARTEVAPARVVAEPAPASSPVQDGGGGLTLTAEPNPDEGDGGDAKRRPPLQVPAKPSPVPHAPASQPAPAPVEQPVATPSSELPPPIAEPSAEEPSPVPGNGNAYGKGSGKGPGGDGPPGLSGK